MILSFLKSLFHLIALFFFSELSECIETTKECRIGNNSGVGRAFDILNSNNGRSYLQCLNTCTTNNDHGLAFDIFNMESGRSTLQCLNRTEEERNGHHIATTGGGFMITCGSEDGPTQFFFEGDMVSPLLDFFVTRFHENNARWIKVVGAIYQNNTGLYGCRTPNKSFTHSIYLYASDNFPPYILENGMSSDIYMEENITLLPCVSGDAFVPVNLYIIIEKRRIKLNSDFEVRYTYDRTKGFYVNTSVSEQTAVQGQYMCSTDYENDFRKYNLHTAKGFRIYPSSYKIFVKEWDKLKLKCETKSPQTFLWSEQLLNAESVKIITSEIPNRNLKYIQEFVTEEGALESLKAINISCGSIYTWTVEINSLGLRQEDLNFTLSAKEKEIPIQCSSTSRTPELMLIPCSNRIQCDFRRNCLLDDDKCGTVAKVFGRLCWTPNCRMLIDSPAAGTIICSVDSTIKITQYYTAFDGFRYSVDAQVKESKLLRIDKNNKPIYDKTNSTFYSKGVGFLLSQMLQWGFVYRNGTTVFLKHGVDFNDTEELGQLQQITRKSSIYIPSTNVIKIIVVAPLLNSTDKWINVTRNITVLESTEPRITNQDTNFTFYIGETNKNLICTAEGNPQPEIHWEKNGRQLQLLGLPYTNSDSGYAVLRFPAIKAGHAGEFTCAASNFRGTARKEFKLTVNDTPPGSEKSISILGLGFGSLFVIIVLILCLGLLYNSLRKSKILIRQLTSDEVDEFLLGSKLKKVSGETSGDSGNDESGNRTTVTDFLALPYNVEYEIGKEALEIKNEILGSGAYGIVLLGTLDKHGSKITVAVKTVSQDADVFYFKALLSELKIMSHIGKAPNVVALLGACTKEIKHRKVYIILEYCGKGSLNDYLRKNRCNYFDNSTPKNSYALECNIEAQTVSKTNYANITNGYVVMETVPDSRLANANAVTHLNLCSWALETAQGMEYLASKKIVHGDLATRNILLTGNRVAKITDFGLSKQLYENTLYKRKNEIPVPWRWMAIEVLKDMIFSSEGDMWSYGVTLWEIFSLAEIPYAGAEWSHSFLMDIENGNRLTCPKYADMEIYEIMKSAWHNDPSCRPSFTMMVEKFREIN